MSESPFNYQVRVSPKSRNVRLRVTLQKRLKVVVPKGYDESYSGFDLNVQEEITTGSTGGTGKSRAAPISIWLKTSSPVLPVSPVVGHCLNTRTENAVNHRLTTLSQQTGLFPQQAMLKRQRTRWASCPKRGTITLNAQLLFLPQIDAHLREMWKLIPRWAS